MFPAAYGGSCATSSSSFTAGPACSSPSSCSSPASPARSSRGTTSSTSGSIRICSRRRRAGPPLASLDLAAKVEAADPRAKVTYVPLQPEPGHTLALGVEPRVDPKTGNLYDLDYNQVFLDPASGEIVGKRYWGRIALDAENLLPFLYKLHYSMHMPDFANFDRWGMWLMGIVGIVWMFDCFVGFYLTLPSRGARRCRQWRCRRRPRRRHAARQRQSPQLVAALEARLADQARRQQLPPQPRPAPRLRAVVVGCCCSSSRSRPYR